MIKINMKIEICESRTSTLGTLSMISIEIDFVSIYYNIFNNTAIIYIDIQYLILLTFQRPVLLSYHPIFLHPYRFLKPVSFLGANRNKGASVCSWLLRGAI